MVRNIKMVRLHPRQFSHFLDILYVLPVSRSFILPKHTPHVIKQMIYHTVNVLTKQFIALIAKIFDYRLCNIMLQVFNKVDEFIELCTILRKNLLNRIDVRFVRQDFG